MKKELIILALIATVTLTGCENGDKEAQYDTSTEMIILQENEMQEVTQNGEDTLQESEELIDNVSSDNMSTDNTSGEYTTSGEEASNIDIELIPVTSSNLSNTTNAWGFRRMKDNVQPEFASQYIKVLDDYEGIYVGNKEEKRIYLTFDEGYENGYTDDILDTLKEKEVTVAFFVTMPYVKQNPDLIKRMIDEGHIVGNHTVNHPSMPSVTNDEKLKEEIMGLHNYMVENYDYEMTYLRPPKGEYSERTTKISRDLGYSTVLWSSAYDDWDVNKQGRLDYARKMILNYLHNGCVMLLHAVSKDNTELLGEMIDEIQNRGYEFYSLDEFER